MNAGGDACTRTELQLHFLPSTVKDEIGPDVVGANDTPWKPAAQMQGTGECTVMQLRNHREPPESGEDSLTLAASGNMNLFFHDSGCLPLFAQGEANFV